MKIDERRKFDGILPGCYDRTAGWSSLVARWAHNPKVGGSNPPPATNELIESKQVKREPGNRLPSFLLKLSVNCPGFSSGLRFFTVLWRASSRVALSQRYP